MRARGQPAAMFSVPGVTALILFIILRPQEYFTFLQKLPLLYIFCAGAIGGYVIDQKLRLLRPIPARTLIAAIGFYLWVIVTIALKVPGAAKLPHIIEFTIVFVMYFVLAQGVQSFRALRMVAVGLAVALVGLAIIGVHQHYAPNQCVLVENKHLGEGVPDGRSCDHELECLGVDAEPGALYTCQQVGLMGTMALDGRVRYRGELQDPNELALAVCLGLPLLIAFAWSRRTWRWWALCVIGGGLILQCVIATQSRGGLLVFLAVLGVYFVRRFGIKYALIGVVAVLPLMMLKGGRSDAAADKSTMERYEAWRAGETMFREDPVFGVGHGMFVERHYLTAHNSYILIPAETGIIGMLLWMSVLYLSVKIPLTVLRDFKREPAARPAVIWGTAILAMLAGFVVQMQFLSLAYHSLLWILFGFAGAYYGAVKSHAPDWDVEFRGFDVAVVATICVSYIVLLDIMLRSKGF